jgi:hypothetical protein
MVSQEITIANASTANPGSEEISMRGYLHSAYAESLMEFGTPRELPRCGGWVLERQIPGLPHRDAMGCYPLFVCQDWSHLQADLDEIGNDLVSLALVTDPFGAYDPTYLQQCFKDKVVPFKNHFIVDRNYPIHDIVSEHHRRCARKALRKVKVEIYENPTQFLEEWHQLYAALIKKHNVKGIRAFSRNSFARQLSIPGTVMLRAVHQDVPVGMQVWFVQGEVGYGHLSGYSELGYKVDVSYALIWTAIKHLPEHVRWLDLGGGAGVANDGKDGLSLFKQGWSNETRTTYFCGRIFDHERYADIVQTKGIAATEYFPAYRQGEFG